MSIAVLGPLTVDGGAARLAPRDRVVLAALAASPGGPLNAAQIADALWGEDVPTSWLKVVQGCVMRLRRVLGANAVETTSQGYRLRLATDEVDARQFERLVGRAHELLTLNEHERASYALGEALALWRGRPLVEIEDWDRGRTEAGRLDELRLAAEELRVEAALRTGRHQELLPDARGLVEQAPLRERRWALLALAQYQAGRQAEALRTLHQVRTVLARELGLDPGPDLVALEQAILRQDPSLAAEAALPVASVSCPYQGLRPYDLDDADAFFGREAEVTACIRRLAGTGVLAVVGPSGSGKSSLVRAGLAAARVRDRRRVVVVTPGAHPMDSLSAVPRSGPLPLLVVDQCEEAFTLCDDDAERARFLAALVEHAGRAELVVAMRADRLGDLSAHPAFARLVERSLYLLGAMGEADLRATIEGPARQAGLPIEPGLTDLLVSEVLGEPGALPLLSHALVETWQRREGRTLTVAGYRDSGGIRGAVAQSAEQVYEGVPVDQRPALRALLLRLVAPTGEGEPMRARLPRRLVAADEEHERLIELLVGARLVTSDDGLVELAHEALARAWPRLRGWLEEDSEGQRTLHHLTEAADAWEEMDRPESELYGGIRLVQALAWRDRARPHLTPSEQAFLDACGARQDDQLREATRRAEREAATGRRTRRLAAGLAAALVCTMVLAGLAVGYQRDATARAADASVAGTLADANRLAALSTTVNELDLSLLLAAEAARTADTPETRDGLLTALVEHRRATGVVPLRGQSVEDLDLGNRGRTMFADMYSGVVAWRVGSTAEPTMVTDTWYGPYNIDASPTDDLVAVLGLVQGRMRAGVFTAGGERRMLIEGDTFGGWPTEVAFTPDGRALLFTVVSGSRRRGVHEDVRRVDLSTGTARTLHTGVLRSPDTDAWMDATFADDGSAVALWTDEEDGSAAVLDLADGTRTRLRLDPRPSDVAGIVPLPSGAAQLWTDGAITLYDLDGRPTQVIDGHDGPVRDVLVSDDGSWATTTGDDGEVVIWDVDAASGLWSQRESLTGHSGPVTGAELAPDGRTLLTGSQDNSIITWDLSADAGFGSAYPGLDGRWIANRPQLVRPGLLVAPTRPVSRIGTGTGGAQPARDTLRVAATFLDPGTGKVVDQVPVGRTVRDVLFGSSVAVSPDRRMVAVTSGFATTVLDTRSRKVLGRVALPAHGARGPGGPLPHEVVWSAGWTRDGARLLLGADGGLVVVDPTTWTVERRVRLGTVQVIEQSPDGHLLAVGEAVAGGEDVSPAVWILDAETLELRRTLRLEDNDFPHDLSFSPDGGLLAAGGIRGVLTVFDVETGQRVSEPIEVHDGFVQQVEWTPDGRTVVSSAADGTVGLYDAERDLVRAVPLPGSDHPREGVGHGYTHLVPPTADEVVALSGERPGHRYPMDPSAWLDQACAVAGRDLTEAEWARYLPDRPYRPTCSDLP